MDFKITKIKLIVSFVSGLVLFLVLNGAIISGKLTFVFSSFKRTYQSFFWSLLTIGIIYLVLSFFQKNNQR